MAQALRTIGGLQTEQAFDAVSASALIGALLR